ncbi:MAG TPA: hypothetical protein VGK25_00060 [Ignavibacteria bacterium]|jgi:hypothetical protein
MNRTDSQTKIPSAYIYLGTFFIAFSTLALEVTLTRIFSVITFYHLAFFAVSIAMLGMTAGAITVYFRPEWFEEHNIGPNTAKACLAYSAAAAIALTVLCLLPVYFIYSLMFIFSILIVTAACSLPFYFSGMVVSVVLTKYPLPIGKLYASDLIGASLGCLFVLGGLELFDAPGLILLSGAIGIISVFCFGYRSLSLRSKRWSIIVLVLLISGVFVNTVSDRGFRPINIKGHQETLTKYAVEKWNSFSRIAVDEGIERVPHLWGPSPVMPADSTSFVYQMTIDGEAGTHLTRFTKLEDIQYLRYDITNAAYYLKEGSESACVIGVGGGRDIHSAILFGVRKIVGVDVNPIFINLLNNKFRNEANISNRPDVKLVVDEARSYLSRSDEKFSIIQMSLIDTWAATGAGAMTLTENSLYTVEAWKIFLNRLDTNGIYTLSRWYNPQNLGETGRGASLAVAALFELGINEPAKHIAMLTVSKLSTLIVSKSPFLDRDISKLKEIASSLKYNFVIVPGELPSNAILRKIISSKSKEELFFNIKDEPLNYLPPTDENPYFFNMLRLNHLSEIQLMEGVHYGNLQASLALVVLIFSLFSLTILTIILPLIYRSRIKNFIKGKTFWKAVFYFSLIGAGFMMTEIGLMQRLSVFLGHPVYALGILLFTIILSAGIGSFFSEHLPVTRSPWKYVLPAFAAIAILAINFILNAVISSMITSPMLSKIIISILVIFPVGFTLGFFFPMGMRLAKSRSPEETPWLWALNGIFGVLFSALAVFFSIYFSISLNFYLASLCYATILILIKGLSQPSTG